MIKVSKLFKVQYKIYFNLSSPIFFKIFKFWLVLHYLFTMTEEQTLVMYSGHPMGLFPSSPNGPRDQH